MTTFCGWCHKVFGEIEPKKDVRWTSTICEDCLEVELAKLHSPLDAY